MKILLTGGGSLGPVTPLLALVEAWKKKYPKTLFVWVGTTYGPEKTLIEKEGIPFFVLPTARLPRYPSFEWMLFPWRFFSALFLARSLLKKERPDFIASAGGFTSVPLVLMGRVQKIPSWIHQQDAVPLLTTRLLTPFVSLMTVAWPFLLPFFSQRKTVVIGNPVRASLFEGDVPRAIASFGLQKEKPTILVTGGGGGAVWLNDQMVHLGSWFVSRANVIHLTGKGKMDIRLQAFGSSYFVTEFLEEKMADALALADLVISRGGMGAITESAALGKPTIFIPLPHSPQEKNVAFLEEQNAAIVLHQDMATPENIKELIESLLQDELKRHALGLSLHRLLPTDIGEKLVDLLQKTFSKTKTS